MKTRVASVSILLATACGGDEVPVELLDIERLAYVTAGRGQLSIGVDYGAGRDLVVDRWEVSRGQWRAWTAGRAIPLPEPYADDWLPGTEDWPATGMDLAQARAFAELRGMRLPTVAEWMWFAAGSGGQKWPYGIGEEQSTANTADLGLGRLAPVGTFFSGETPTTGIHDLIGSVWEWVEPPLPTIVRQEKRPVYIMFFGRRRVGSEFVRVTHSVFPSLASVQGSSAYPVWAMGGSYQYPSRPLFEKPLVFNAQGLEPEHRATDLGFRCVATAEDYLWENAERWSDPDLRSRLVAVGRSRSWNKRAVAVLERLSRRDGAPRAISWLLRGARE